MEQNQHRLRGKLQVDTVFGVFLGDTRIRLLEAIDLHGSISQAATVVPLSYKSAGHAIDAMNNLADQPVVTRATGGGHGGGTLLTNYGRKVIALYRALESVYQITLDRLAQSMNSDQSGGFQQFRQRLKRMSMKTSARNPLWGEVTRILNGPVNADVTLTMPGGKSVCAVFRASAVILCLYA